MAAKTSVIISASSTDELTAFIKACPGRTKPTAERIVNAALSAEDELEIAGVAKTHRVGCEYVYRDAGPWANAYKYAKAVVSFRLRRKKDGWVIVSAAGDSVYPKTPEIDRIDLTPAAKDAVVRAALDSFGLLPVKKAA